MKKNRPILVSDIKKSKGPLKRRKQRKSGPVDATHAYMFLNKDRKLKNGTIQNIAKLCRETAYIVIKYEGWVLNRVLPRRLLSVLCTVKSTVAKKLGLNDSLESI